MADVWKTISVIPTYLGIKLLSVLTSWWPTTGHFVKPQSGRGIQSIERVYTKNSKRNLH